MTNNRNPLTPAQIIKSVSPLGSGKYDLISMIRDSDRAEKISSRENYILILPFERTEDSKIKAIYGVKFENPATGQPDVSLLTDVIDFEKDTTSFDSVGRSLLEEAGLNIEDAGLNEDDIFYIGTMTTSEPAIAKFKCYAIDLTKISRPNESIRFTRNLSKSAFTKDDSSEIVKIGFHEIVNGDYSDASILAGSFLLVSYFQ